MAKKREKAVYAFIRRGPGLVPELEYDARALEGIGQGQRVRIEVKEFRNLGRLRAYWKMLHDVVQSTECAASAEQLHEAMKLELGIVELVKVGHLTVAIPGSIAFDKMTEPEMVEWFRIAEKWLAEQYQFVREDRSAA